MIPDGIFTLISTQLVQIQPTIWHMLTGDFLSFGISCISVGFESTTVLYVAFTVYYSKPFLQFDQTFTMNHFV